MRKRIVAGLLLLSFFCVNISLASSAARDDEELLANAIDSLDSLSVEGLRRRLVGGLAGIVSSVQHGPSPLTTVDLSPGVACVICQDAESEELVTLPCDQDSRKCHQFHATCIVGWTKASGQMLSCLVCGKKHRYRDLPDAILRSFDVNTVLHYAIRDGDIVLAERACNNGADIWGPNNEVSGSLLHLAARYGKVESIKFLVKRGLPINVHSDAGFRGVQRVLPGNTPLHDAVLYAHDQAVACLISLGANLSMCGNGVNVFVSTPLELAASVKMNNDDDKLRQRDCLKWLIRDERDLGELPGCEFGTVLHGVTLANNHHAVVFLMRKGASPVIELANQFTPVALAIQNNFIDVVRAMLDEGLAVDTISDRHMLAGGATLLDTAAACGHIDIVRLLLARGASVHAVSLHGRNALHGAAQNTMNTQAILRLLLDAGADCTLQTVTTHQKSWFSFGSSKAVLGFTPLYRAVIKNNIIAVETLLGWATEHGQLETILAQRCGEHGETPLHCAARMGREECVAILLAAGARNDILDSEGKTPSMRAVEAHYPAIVDRIVPVPTDE